MASQIAFNITEQKPKLFHLKNALSTKAAQGFANPMTKQPTFSQLNALLLARQLERWGVGCS